MQLSSRFELLKGNIFYGPRPIQLRRELFLFDHERQEWLLLLIADFPLYLMSQHILRKETPNISLPIVALMNISSESKIGLASGVKMGIEDYRIVENDRTQERYVVDYQRKYTFEFFYETIDDYRDIMGIQPVQEFKVYSDDMDVLQHGLPPLSKRIKLSR